MRPIFIWPHIKLATHSRSLFTHISKLQSSHGIEIATVFSKSISVLSSSLLAASSFAFLFLYFRAICINSRLYSRILSLCLFSPFHIFTYLIQVRHKLILLFMSTTFRDTCFCVLYKHIIYAKIAFA